MQLQRLEVQGYAEYMPDNNFNLVFLPSVTSFSFICISLHPPPSLCSIAKLLLTGIKGNNCEKVVEGINEQLGEVVASSPTEEMFEQEVVVDQTLYNSDSSDWSSGGNTW